MKIDIYSIGIVTCSVCVPKDATVEQIEKQVNKELPTGINSAWKVSKDTTFKEKERTNPCQCDQDENRLHYLLNC